MQKREEETEGERVVMTWVEGMEDMRWEDCELALMSLLSNKGNAQYQVMCSYEQLRDLAERLCAKATFSDLQPVKLLSQIWFQKAVAIPIFVFVSPTDFSTLNLPRDVFLAVKTSLEVSFFTANDYIRRCQDMGLSSFQPAETQISDEELFASTESFCLPLKSHSQPPIHPAKVQNPQQKPQKSGRQSLDSLLDSKPESGNTTWPVEIGLYRDLDKGRKMQFYVVVRVVWVGDWKWVKMCTYQVHTETMLVLLGKTFTFIPVDINPTQPLYLQIWPETGDIPLSQELYIASLLEIPIVEAGTSPEKFEAEQKSLREDLAQYGDNIEAWKAERSQAFR